MDGDDSTSDPRNVPTLRELLSRHADRTGESRRALAKRSGIAHQTLGYWAAGHIKVFPDPDTIRVFANATSYSEQAVLLAAARTIGLRVDPTSELAAMLPAAADRLTPEQQRAVLSVIAAMNPPATSQEVAQPPAPPIDFPRRSFLREVGEAARDDDGDE